MNAISVLLPDSAAFATVALFANLLESSTEYSVIATASGGEGAVVRGLVPNTPNQQLVKAIVNGAHGLGWRTIAEGVQNGETVDLLREHGVDPAQPLRLLRPQPLDSA